MTGARSGTIAEAIEALREDGLVVHPTSTVYGIGGAPTPLTDAEISRLKGRPLGRPLIRLAPSVDILRRECPTVVWDERAGRLSAAFWPGRLTIVLDDGTKDGLAVRVDSHPAIAALLARWGHLMSSTSLNPHASEPCRTPAGVWATLDEMPATDRRIVFVDAGALPDAPPSTIVTLRERPARVLREGSVTTEDVRRCMEEVPVDE